MTDLALQSATKLTTMLAEGDIGSVELTRHYLDRIDRLNGDLNCVVQTDADGALKAAGDADAKRAAGDNLGPLHGLPMTIKDAYEVGGMISAGGAPELKDHIPETDADPVARLRAAGAIILGKTNVPYMSGDWQSYNDVYGRSNNPWDLERTPGGSSGGAAGAVAAGLSAADIGSDIGGSIRIPAHFCGLYGLKPSFGLMSLRGHIPPPPGFTSQVDLSVGGPLARSAKDLGLLWNVMMGPPAWDKALKIHLPPPRAKSVTDLRVAVWADDPFSPVSKETADAVNAAAKLLEEAGASVTYDAKPDFDFEKYASLYEMILGGIMVSGFPPKLVERLANSAKDYADDDLGHAASLARGAAMTYAQSLGVNAHREKLKQKWISFFADYDILLCPNAAVPAIPHDTETSPPMRRISVDGIDRSYTDMMHWMGLATLCHLPAASIPFAQSKGGLPIGVQAIGPLQEDATVLRVAEIFEELIGLALHPAMAIK